MPTIQATQIRNEGNIVYIKADPAIGVLTLVSFTDDATGESGSTQFVKTFRYSKNGVTWTDWQPLTVPAITSISVATTDTLCIELAYEKQQPLGTDVLEITEAEIGITMTTFTESDYFKNSIFYQFFQSNDFAVLKWYVSVLEKLYERGIIPSFIDRLNEEGLPDDFVDFWKAVTKYFAYIVIYARSYQNFPDNIVLIAEYLKQRGLIVSKNNTLDELNNLMNTFYQQIGKRGTINIIKKEGVRTFDGELLRLIDYDRTIDEFLFNLYKPEHFGWTLGRSTPMHRNLYQNDNLNKSYETGTQVLDLAKYPITGDVSIVVDGDNSTMFIDGAGGISSEGGLKYIRISPELDYEISFLIKKSSGQTLNFGISAYDVDENPVYCKRVSDGVVTNQFLLNATLQRDDKYILVRGILFNYNKAIIAGETTEINQGSNLILDRNIVSIVPKITINSGEANIYAIRVLPLYTSHSRAFIQSKNIIDCWLENNNNEYNFKQLRDLITRYLIPYNSSINLIELNRPAPIPTEYTDLEIETLLRPMMRVIPNSVTPLIISGHYSYDFLASGFKHIFDLKDNYDGDNKVTFETIGRYIAGNPDQNYIPSVSAMPDLSIPYEIAWVDHRDEMMVWSDIEEDPQTATFEDVEGNKAICAPVIIMNATANAVLDYMLASIRIDVVSATPETITLRLTKIHAAPYLAVFDTIIMDWLNDANVGSPDPADPTNVDKTIITLGIGTYTFGVKTNYTYTLPVPDVVFPPSVFTMVIRVS